MADVAGFWSYARADDEAEGGRIRRLATSITTEYAMLTGEAIDVFLDRDAIEWGDEWRRRIDEALAGTAFFIPVLTPRYFSRPECRRELLTFAGHASSLGVSELLLPLLYVQLPGFSPDATDEAIALVARMQYVDWTSLRLEDETSAEYRKGVHAMATRLAGIASELGGGLASEPDAEAMAGPAADDDAPGFFEILAGAEEALPRWQATIEAFAPVMEEIQRVTEEATVAMQVSDERGAGFAGRVRVAAEYGRALADPASRFLDLGTTYASELVTVDAGILTLIRLASAVDDDEERRAACELFTTIRDFAGIARENAKVMGEFSTIVEQTAKFSREVKPATSKLVSGIQRLMDGQAVIDEWVLQIDAADLDCLDVANE